MALHPFPALWEFQRDFGQPHSVVPGLPDGSRRVLRKKLLAEEYQEYLDGEANDDLVEIGDALADMVYIIYGTAVEYGLPLDALFDEVHRSNMTKLDPVTGRPIRREDGKIMKPVTYSPPNLAAIIEERSAACLRLIGEGEVPADVFAPAEEKATRMADAAYSPLSIMEDYFFASKDKASEPDVGDCEYRDADGNADACCEGQKDADPYVERFVVYIPVGDLAPARADARVADVKRDFVEQAQKAGDKAIYYFLPTKGRTKVERI